MSVKTNAMRVLDQRKVEYQVHEYSPEIHSAVEAAQAMGARLRKAGLPAADVKVLAPPGGPKKGNLVALLRGSGAGQTDCQARH